MILFEIHDAEPQASRVEGCRYAHRSRATHRRCAWLLALCVAVSLAPCFGQSVRYVPALENYAGNPGDGNSDTNNGALTADEFAKPEDIVFDASGDIFVADEAKGQISMIYEGGATAASLLSTLGVSCASGCTYAGPVVGNEYTLAGNGTEGEAGDGSKANITTTELDGPVALTIDSTGNLYVSDSLGFRIREINASTGVISTIAGTGTTGKTGNNVAATSALLSSPAALAVDSAGDLFIMDKGSNAVRVIYEGGATLTSLLQAEGASSLTNGYLYTVAGELAASSADTTTQGTPALSTTFNGPYGVALDASGDIYISDTSNYVIRVVYAGGSQLAAYLASQSIAATPTVGAMYIVAGTPGTQGTTAVALGDGGAALSGRLDYAQRVHIDRLGNLVISDTNAEEVRYVNLNTTTVNGFMQTGYIYKLAGTAVTSGDVPSTRQGTIAGISSEIASPLGSAVDASNNIFLSDSGESEIRKIDASPVSPYAAASVGATGVAQSFYAEVVSSDTLEGFQLGAGFSGLDFALGTTSGCTLGSSSAAGAICTEPVTFAPQGAGLRTAPLLLNDNAGNKYALGLSGVGNAPQLSFSPGGIATTTGTGVPGYTGDNSMATAATLSAPSGAVADTAGDVYIADTANNVVRMITPAGTITTVAGNGTAGYAGDGSAAAGAELNGPKALALDAADNLYIADTGNSVVREVLYGNGVISTVAGNGTSGDTGNGSLATASELASPAGVAVDLYGNLFIADTGNGAVRMVSAQTGVISVVATLADPAGVSYAPLPSSNPGITGEGSGLSGVLLVASPGSNTISQITLSNTLPISPVVIAGDGSSGDTGDGAAATAAELNSPSAAVEDAAGDIYIADTGNSVIREVSSTNGFISTFAGNGTSGYAGDGGSAAAAELEAPVSVAIDASANVYVADLSANVLRKINTVSGAPTLAFATEAVNSTSGIQTISVNNTGNQTLALSALTIPSSFAQVTGNSTDCSATESIPVGAYCRLRLTFTPSAPGAVVEPLSITSNSLNGSSTLSTITLTGSGGASATGLSLSGLPSTVDALAQQTVTVSALNGSSVDSGYTGTVTFSSADSGATLPASYTFTSLDAGTHAFTVTFATAGSQFISVTDSANSLTNTQTTNVVAAAQSINFPAPPSLVQLGNGAPFALGATASSGLGVSYVSAGPAVLSGSTLAPVGVGTIMVTANQSGNSTYAQAAPVSQTVQVSPPPFSSAGPSTTGQGSVNSITVSLIFNSSMTLGNLTVSVAGAPGTPFTIVNGGGTCVIGNGYAPASSCTVQLNYSPTAPGLIIGTVEAFDTNNLLQAAASAVAVRYH